MKLYNNNLFLTKMIKINIKLINEVLFSNPSLINFYIFVNQYTNMKTNLLLLFTVFVLGLNAQNLTLTQSAYEPIIGDTNRVYIMDTTFYFSGMPVSTAGDGVTWDFTGLVETTTINTTAYVDPTSQTVTVPTNCDVVQKQGTALSFLNSVTSPTTQTELLGTTFGSITASFSNPAIVAKYPITYGYSLSDAFAGSATTITINGNLTTNADGRGTLKLPYGNTYNNVLRIKSVQTVTASVFILTVANIKTTTYQYFHASSKFPVLTITRTSSTFSTQTTESSSATVNKATYVIGVKENAMNMVNFNVYPNPASEAVKVELENNKNAESINIVNALGQKVASFTNTNKISISELPKGLYYIEVKSDGYFGRKPLVKTN